MEWMWKLFLYQTLQYMICFYIFFFRLIVPRFLPALSRGVPGELRPHPENPADWVQGPQTDPDPQGGPQYLASSLQLVVFFPTVPTLPSHWLPTMHYHSSIINTDCRIIVCPCTISVLDNTAFLCLTSYFSSLQYLSLTVVLSLTTVLLFLTAVCHWRHLFSGSGCWWSGIPECSRGYQYLVGLPWERGGWLMTSSCCLLHNNRKNIACYKSATRTLRLST